jgi:NTP pyrophosphatase (non-canonical NTP hydrolase)
MNFPDASPSMSQWKKYAVLGEEFGEVANAMLEASFGKADAENIRRELIQVAAVAVAWLESL